MTTTDARKRNRDMADAHETARERGERAKAGHPIEWFVYDETQTFTREHLAEWQAEPAPADVDPDEDRAARKSALAAENLRRAEKLEADLARVTKERDQAWRFRGAALEARDKAQAKADRYDALRADVERALRVGAAGFLRHEVKEVLDRDDERAES